MVVSTFLKDATMFGEELLTDQEEFEHLLYNQVYHSVENTDSADAVDVIPSLTKQDSENMNYSGDRYFHGENTGRNPYSFVRGGFSNVTDYPNQFLNLQSSGFPVTVVSPINNIVVLPNPPTQVFVNNKANRPKRWKRARKKKEKRGGTLNTSVPVVATSSEKRSPQKSVEKKSEAVDVYDSNDSDVCCIEVKPPLVVVSSDDEEVEEKKPKVVSAICEEKLESTDNDVIFVPTKPKEIETIAIDEEPPKSPEATPEHIPAPHKEILDTPESTMSNDFLENPSEFTQSKFNFSLHGADFNTAAKELNKPTVVERSETESSASDVSAPLKTAVFNEIPFDSPTKNIFSEENNLENFADFIVPKRAQSGASTPKSPAPLCGGAVSRKRSASFSSDSSSEEDYDEVDAAARKKSQRLPSLSVFEGAGEEEAALKGVEMDVGDAEESKVNVVGLKGAVEASGVEGEASKVQILSDDDDDCEENPPNEALSADSDVSNCAVINMENFITIDEDFGELSNNEVEEEEEEEKVEEEEEAIVIDSSDSDEMCFNTDDLRDVGEDLQVGMCTRYSVAKHEPRDETVQKMEYSFDAVWSEDKERFYGESWGQENFSVTQAQKTMSDDPNLWKILDVDKEYIPILKSKRKMRKQVKCFLCGIPGHMEPRCPNKLCAMCGNPVRNTTTICSACTKNPHQVCKLCKTTGHLANRCPDLWRRYFLTTKEGPLVRPTSSELKDDSQLCCSGCGKIGHLEHMCKYYNRIYPPVNPVICRYDDVYKGKGKKTAHQQQQDDLRKVLQNKERKSANVNIPSFAASYEGDQITVTAVNDCANVGSIFDRNKELVAKNSHTTFTDCAGQQTSSVFDRNKDLASTSGATGDRQKFSFLALSQSYFTKAKKSRLLLNPCVTSNFPKQKRPPRRNAAPAPVFNGFEPDVEKPAAAPAVKIVHATESFPSSVDDMRVFLNNAMQKMNACRNLRISEVWQELQKQQDNFDRKPNELTHQTIKSLFERLHIFLFGIHKLLGGANAVSTLKEWQNYLSNSENDAIVLPQHGLNDIRNAYDYIFGSSRRDLDYGQLVNTVDTKRHWMNYVHHEIHRDYNFFLQNSNGSAFKKLHALYAKVKSGKGNVEESAQQFKNAFKIFYSGVCRNKV